jgi:hypothetical protein
MASIGLQPGATSVAGCQVGLICDMAGSTIEGSVTGPQTTTADASYRQTASGVGTLPIQRVGGAQTVVLTGIIITPAGAPQVSVQAKGVQASIAWFAKANSYLRLVKTT